MEPITSEHQDNQYLWTGFAGQALAGLLAQPMQPGQWRQPDSELTEWAGKLGDRMVAEYRKRWPWQSPYQGGPYPAGDQYTYEPNADWVDEHPDIPKDTLRHNPAFRDFHKLAKTFGLTVPQANAMWSNTETAH